MDLKRFPFLALPPLLLLFLFCADRLYEWSGLYRYSLYTYNFDEENYASRIKLLDQLRNEYPLRKRNGERPALILGTSRSMGLRSSDIIRDHKTVYTYNFSAPGACPAYYDYIMENVGPEITSALAFAIIEVDTPVIGRKAGKLSLAYSYDLPFLIRHLRFDRHTFENPWIASDGGFTYDALETFLAKRAFALYRYPFHPANIRDNLKKIAIPAEGFREITLLELRERILERESDLLGLELGALPNANRQGASNTEIEKSSVHTGKKYLSRFRFSRTQLFFLKKVMKRFAKKRIPVLLYWPLIAKPLRMELAERRMIAPVQTPLLEYAASLEKRYSDSFFLFVDPNDDPGFTCRDFLDSHHLTGNCMAYLADHLSKRLHEAGH